MNKINNIRRKLIFFGLILIAATTAAQAQVASNPPYTLQQSVIAGGGGTSGGAYTVNGTLGQAITSAASAAPYTVTSGFWQAVPGSPTAASVSIGGRVLTNDGRGIRNVLVTLHEADGTARTILTGAFGYYRFGDVSSGQTVLITVSSKRFEFTQPAQIFNVTEEIFNLDFIAGKTGKPSY